MDHLALNWQVDKAESGDLTRVETAEVGPLLLRVVGLVNGWGGMLRPPQPGMAERWSWQVQWKDGRSVAFGDGCPDRATAIHAAEQVATLYSHL